MYELIFFLAVAGIGWIYIKAIRKVQKARRMRGEKLGDGYCHDEIVIVKWREYRLPMTYLEYLEVWVNMPDWHKKKLARDMEAKMKSGKLEIMKNPGYKNLPVLEDNTKAIVQIHPD